MKEVAYILFNVIPRCLKNDGEGKPSFTGQELLGIRFNVRMYVVRTTLARMKSKTLRPDRYLLEFTSGDSHDYLDGLEAERPVILIISVAKLPVSELTENNLLSDINSRSCACFRDDEFCFLGFDEHKTLCRRYIVMDGD